MNELEKQSEDASKKLIDKSLLFGDYDDDDVSRFDDEEFMVGIF